MSVKFEHVKLFLVHLLGISMGLQAQPEPSICGTVRDASSGEPLARVRVELMEVAGTTQTDSAGRFALDGVNPGEYTLQVTSVGYRLIKKPIRVGGNGILEFEIALTPEALRRTDSVEVRADRFDLYEGSRAAHFTLEGNDIKNLASVLADDPLRSLHSVPGVVSNDDFNSQFSVMGAGFDRIGLYFDGILLHNSVHSAQMEGSSGSLAMFSGDVLESLTVESLAYPLRFGDRTAGAVDVQMREGSRSHTNLRATTGAAGAGLLGEGPLGKRGTWLASVRRSYLQYLIQRVASDPTLAFGFVDEQAKIGYDLGCGSHVTFEVLDGTSSLDRSHWRDKLLVNSAMLAGGRSSMASLAWQYSRPGFLLTSRAALLRERFRNTNRYSRILDEGSYAEWVGSSDASWEWRKGAPLEMGWSGRWVRGDGLSDFYYSPASGVREGDYHGTGIRTGAYANQSWSLFKGRLRFAAGARWDHLNTDSATAISPHASLAFMPFDTTRIEIGWGEYAQFPDVPFLWSKIGSLQLLPERAAHYVASFEQRIGSRGRFRIQAYNRQDRDLIFRPWREPRIVSGVIYNGDSSAKYQNSLQGYARGLEFLVERRTANRFNGWASYTLGFTRLQDTITGSAFPSDYDQRHTVNVYVSSRLSPAVNLSAKWTYGSSLPVPGYFQSNGRKYFLSTERNRLRLSHYERLDLRVNKAIVFERWKMNLYAEVVNVFNHPNYRFESYDGHNHKTGLTWLSVNPMFPVLPSAGLTFEF